jgi:IclR family acetate operon transcriptional repressor
VTQLTGKPRAAEPEPASSLVGSDRVLAVLAAVASRPSGISLDELARVLQSPKPTVHRALAALRRAGFASQHGRGHYLLGDEFLRLAFANLEGRPDHLRVQPILELLAERYGETAHYAILDDRSVVYRAKVDPGAGAVKLTSTVGGRNPAHSTAVGKLLLAYQLPDDAAVAAWIAVGQLEKRTERTRTTEAALVLELALIRAQSFATEDQENEQGISCLALPLFLNSPSVPSGAISISALTYRTPLSVLLDDLASIRAIVEQRNP